MKAVLLGALCVAALQLPASASMVPVQWRDGRLVDFLDRTLYTFDGDAPEQSRCIDGCIQRWPPLDARLDAKPEGEFTIVTRANGMRQWAYRGKPLYRHVDGKRFSDCGGNLLPSWHVVRLTRVLEAL